MPDLAPGEAAPYPDTFGIDPDVYRRLLTWERRTQDPMLNVAYFRDPRFSVASGGMVLVFFAMFGLFFLITQYFPLVLGYDALGTGVGQAPMALALMVLALNTARLGARSVPTASWRRA